MTTTVEDLVSSTLPLTLRDADGRTDSEGRTDEFHVRTNEMTDGLALEDELEMIQFTPEVQEAIQKV